ncbi:MAG: cell division protein FtsZ, partial [Pseudomonadota bacterium]
MGTGEGEGPNRALEAAERAIANPLLDGVSMQGAKGVIISIIGGEDMKLLEVDEAANHIRELVDPEANIIWGSAFNPDLDGRIRVSVVATGIDGSAEHARPASQALGLGMGRGPKRPALPVTPVADDAADDEAFNRSFTLGGGEPAPAAAPAGDAAAPRDNLLDLATAAAADDQAGDAADDSWSASPTPAANEPAGHADVTGDDAMFDLTEELDEVAPEPSADELVLDAGRLAEPADDGAGRRRRFFGGGGDSAPVAEPAAPAAAAPAAPAAAAAGSTLFERMANLSRGAAAPEEPGDDDDDDGGSAMRIPRFLGRQNNQ